MPTVLGLTFREVLSKKVFYIVMALTLLFVIGYGVALHFTVDDIAKYNRGLSVQKVLIYPQLLSLGLYFSTFIVALMAIFSAVGSISAEIETGVIQAVIPKPIKRTEYILGKFFGYSIMLVLYSSVLYLAVIGVTYYIADYMPGNILSGLLLFNLIPLILIALCLFGSVILSTMANGILIFMMFIIATVGGMLEQIGSAIKNVSLVNMGILSSLLVPTDALYRKMIFGLLTGPDAPLNVFSEAPFASKNPPSDVMIIYALVYVFIVTTVAIRFFKRRDI